LRFIEIQRKIKREDRFSKGENHFRLNQIVVFVLNRLFFIRFVL